MEFGPNYKKNIHSPEVFLFVSRKNENKVIKNLNYKGAKKTFKNREKGENIIQR